MKINQKLTLSFLLVASLASMTTFFTLRSYKKIDTTFEQLMNDSRTLEVLESLKQAGARVVSSTSEICLIHDESGVVVGNSAAQDNITDEERQLEHFGYQAFETSIKRYEEMVRTVVPDDAVTLEAIRSSGNSLIKISRHIIEVKKSSLLGGSVYKERDDFEAAEKAFLENVDEAISRQAAEQLIEQENMDASIALATRQTLGVTALTFILAIFSGVYISFSLSRRIRNLKEATEKVGHGEFDTQMNVDSNDEVGDLARSFNKMTADLKRSRAKIESQGRRLNTIVGNVQGIVWETKTSFENGETFLRFDFVSDYVETMLGYTVEECLSSPDFWLDIVHPDDKERTKRKVGGIFASGEGGMLEFRWIAKDGREIWIESRNTIVRDQSGKTVGLRGIAVDITERKFLEQQLTHQALHDPLTKLGNRVLFRDRVDHAIRRAARSRVTLAVLFLDLDNFKSVNDSLGHAAGDELLISVTERLSACLRPSDTPARLGGDEFAILIEDIVHEDEAAFIAERIRTVISPPFSIGGTEVFVTTSIGIAISINEHHNPEELLRNADVAMYISKSHGKDRYTIFENEMHDVLVKRVRLESDMRSAIEKQEFEVYYQPIIDLQTEQVMGMEALVRWNHPEHGLIPPLDFIPIAEETGLIVPLGQWILEKACMRTRAWQMQYGDDRSLSVTVNIASRQFQEDGLLEIVTKALTRSKLPPQSLILEITERTMLANTEAMIEKLEDLKRLGIRFAIDDFGTGYSSLSYLQRFPVDILKIDKSFIDTIASDKEGAAVAKAIITMSEALHLKTIAEGIESVGQSAELQHLGCELGQGYHFAKPLREAEMSEYLRLSSVESALPDLRSPAGHAKPKSHVRI